MRRRSTKPYAWFAKAQLDIQAAELHLSEKIILTEIMCYHTQPCAKKSLKDYLAPRHLKVFFRSGYLIKLCAVADETFTQLLDVATNLSAAALDVRYPVDKDFEPLNIDSVLG